MIQCPNTPRGHARAHAPEDEAPAAEREQQQRRRQLLRHPGALEESIEAVVGDSRLEREARWMAQP